MTLKEVLDLQILHENFAIEVRKKNSKNPEEYNNLYKTELGWVKQYTKTKILNRPITTEDILLAKEIRTKETLPKDCLDWEVCSVYGANPYKLIIKLQEK